MQSHHNVGQAHICDPLKILLPGKVLMGTHKLYVTASCMDKGLRPKMAGPGYGPSLKCLCVYLL